jgi:hypothetical protein
MLGSDQMCQVSLWWTNSPTVYVYNRLLVPLYGIRCTIYDPHYPFTNHTQ